MKKLLAITGFALGLCVSTISYADDSRPQHFKGLPAPDLATALNNFADYNQRLQARLDSELSDEDLAQIHILTYTLENALETINKELAQLADTLEEVHLASETFDRERLRTNAALYLETSKTLLRE